MNLSEALPLSHYITVYLRLRQIKYLTGCHSKLRSSTQVELVNIFPRFSKFVNSFRTLREVQSKCYLAIEFNRRLNIQVMQYLLLVYFTLSRWTKLLLKLFPTPGVTFPISESPLRFLLLILKRFNIHFCFELINYMKM